MGQERGRLVMAKFKVGDVLAEYEGGPDSGRTIVGVKTEVITNYRIKYDDNGSEMTFSSNYVETEFFKFVPKFEQGAKYRDVAEWDNAPTYTAVYVDDDIVFMKYVRLNGIAVAGFSVSHSEINEYVRV
jgi:hypothetical protein